jgi:hypothetical protein
MNFNTLIYVILSTANVQSTPISKNNGENKEVRLEKRLFGFTKWLGGKIGARIARRIAMGR